MTKIAVILGPNLNMIGVREKEIYGDEGFNDVKEEILKYAQEQDLECEVFQSNHEGILIDKIHNLIGKVDGLIINAGGLAHYSICLRDALACMEIPCLEVHMTNIFAREKFRAVSIISDVCIGIIAGFGKNSYFLAIDALKKFYK